MTAGPLILLLTLAIGSIYSYLVYPVLLVLSPARRKSGNSAGAASENLRMSVIVTAHNEAERIAAKIENTLLLRESHPSIEIIVASDASDDGTDDIVRSFESKSVRLVRSPSRQGKEAAQGLAIRQCNGDIIVFTDVGTSIRQDSISRLTELFSDSRVGAVSSVDRVLSEDGEPLGEGLYVSYEMWLRSLESARGGLIGLSGSFFAARRDVVEEWDADVPSDFCVAINARRLGYDSVSDAGVIGEYKNVEEPADEVSRKVRTVLRGMAALAKHRSMLNPFSQGMFAFQLFSHKLMRWAAPWFAVAYFVTAAYLSFQGPQYLWSLVPVVAFVIPLVVAMLIESTRSNSVVGPVYFLWQSNLAIVRATLQFIAGRRITAWSPSRR